MSAPVDWPALRGTAVQGRIDFKRAIWGKVHAAASDFRWIAAEPGFDFATHPETEVSMGLENRPADGALWRVGDDSCWAVRCYRSRAQDKAGRSSALEKQILQYRPRPDRPDVATAVAALMLLDHVAKLDDSAWWDRRLSPRWQDPKHLLPLNASEPLVWDESSLAAGVEASLNALAQTCPHSALALFYGGLLDGRRPALLEGFKEPPPPRVLAALLLPLPPLVAAGVSWAGWLFSSRYDVEELRRRWTGLLCSGCPEDLRPQPPSSRALSAGGEVAEALLSRRPEGIPLLEWPSATHSSPSGNSSEAASGGLGMGAPSIAERLVSEARLHWDRAVDAVLSGEGWSSVAPHLAEESEALRWLVRFALNDGQHWIDLREAKPHRGRLSIAGPSAPRTRLLLACLDRVRKCAGRSGLGPQEAGIKVDLLRAAVFSLAPHLELVPRVGWPEYRSAESQGPLVPPLYFAPLIAKEDWKHYGGSESEWVRRSLAGPIPELSKPLRDYFGSGA